MNSFSRIYLTGFTRRNMIDCGKEWSWVHEAHQSYHSHQDQINQPLGRDEVIYWDPGTVNSNNQYTDHLSVFNTVTEAVNMGTGNWLKHSMNFHLYAKHESWIKNCFTTQILRRLYKGSGQRHLIHCWSVLSFSKEETKI